MVMITVGTRSRIPCKMSTCSPVLNVRFIFFKLGFGIGLGLNLGSELELRTGLFLVNTLEGYGRKSYPDLPNSLCFD